MGTYRNPLCTAPPPSQRLPIAQSVPRSSLGLLKAWWLPAPESRDFVDAESHEHREKRGPKWGAWLFGEWKFPTNLDASWWVKLIGTRSKRLFSRNDVKGKNRLKQSFPSEGLLCCVRNKHQFIWCGSECGNYQESILCIVNREEGLPFALVNDLDVYKQIYCFVWSTYRLI